MRRIATFGIGSVAFAVLAALGQPPAPTPPPAPAPSTPAAPGTPPTTIENHPPAGHISVPKPDDEWPKAKPEDVNSTEAIVAAYYASTSGKPGEPRDWTRFRSLFHPMAHLVPARPAGDGTAGAFFLGVEDYVQANSKYFEKMGFVDTEVARRVEAYGNIAHVWSTYESRRGREVSDPYSRGIASIQLLKDGDRWWIISVFWDYERPDNKLPEKYQKSPKE